MGPLPYLHSSAQPANHFSFLRVRTDTESLIIARDRSRDPIHRRLEVLVTRVDVEPLLQDVGRSIHFIVECLHSRFHLAVSWYHGVADMKVVVRHCLI